MLYRRLLIVVYGDLFNQYCLSFIFTENLRWMDGWMDRDFTSFSKVFELYKDDGRIIMKGCMQWNSENLRATSMQCPKTTVF